MSDPYATPTADLHSPAGSSVESGVEPVQRQRTGRLFALLNLGLGLYLGQALLVVVIPGVAAAQRGAFSWDVALYCGLLLLPILLVVKGTTELIAPGYVMSVWRQRAVAAQESSATR